MRIIIVLVATIALGVSCSDPAVSKAVGSGGDAATPIAVQGSATGVTVENRTGRPLLNVRIAVDTGSGSPFVRVVATIDTGAKSESRPEEFHTDDGNLLDLATMHPVSIALTARDTVNQPYSLTVPWAQ